jgi:hypothetical protein
MAEAKTKNVYQRLLTVQSTLVAPRQAGGRFGKARSAEQILEALKPRLRENGLVLTTTEKVIERGSDRFYMECTATVFNVDKPEESLSAVAEAREGQEERGLDPSQVTGKASSYAKKYALQHLFSIDDTKDADHEAPGEPVEQPKPAQKPAVAEEDELSRAKKAINAEMESQDIIIAPAKKAFLISVIEQSTIDNLDQANLVMDALENNKEVK